MDSPPTLSLNTAAGTGRSSFAAAPGSSLATPANAIEAQKVLGALIAHLIKEGRLPDRAGLDAFFTLERQGQQLCNRLLTQYVEGDARARVLEWKAWQAAYQLTQSLLSGCQHFLQHVRTLTDDRQTEHELLVQFFIHRKDEFLLRFLRYKRRSDGQWRQLHEMYRSAREHDLRMRANAAEPTDGARRLAGRLEQHYLQMLLLEAMNNGRFSPREALWAHRWFARWCSGSELQLAHIDAGARGILRGFVVDLDGSDGLQRGPVRGGAFLHFDSTPLLAIIDREITGLRDHATPTYPGTPAVRAGQLGLLRKLSILLAPYPREVERRTDRSSVGKAVQAISGFANIVEALRKSGVKASVSAAAPSGALSEATISAYDGPLTTSLSRTTGGPDTTALKGGRDAVPQNWQMKDQSDTGCRMRGQIDNLNRVIPGSLIALRDQEGAPWTIAVIRWLRRLMVDHVEIGVEFLGRRPRFVKMVAGGTGDPAVDELPDSKSRCYAALYLPPSDAFPTMPIKTLLLPAKEFMEGSEAMLLSSSATYRMRLNDAIQQQYEFVLTSFGVIDPPVAKRVGMR